MQIQQNLNINIGALLALNILLAFGSIGLLVRMSPAIEKILQENVCSITAAEEILAEFATIDNNEIQPETLLRIEDAIERAKVNITEIGEIEVLDKIENLIKQYNSNDKSAKNQIVSELKKLIEINRNVMQNADFEAKRLSTAGAWVAAFIGLISFIASLLIMKKLRVRIVDPIVELYDVLESNRRGEHYRRCSSHQASPELQHIHYSINVLLDEKINADQID